MARTHASTTETAKAAADAKQKVEHENRGFFDFGSEEPIVAHISGEFHGLRQRARPTRWTMARSGSRSTTRELAGVRLTDPEVRIKPAMVGNSWYMAVGKYNSRAQVKRDQVSADRRTQGVVRE